MTACQVLIRRRALYPGRCARCGLPYLPGDLVAPVRPVDETVPGGPLLARFEHDPTCPGVS